ARALSRRTLALAVFLSGAPLVAHAQGARVIAAVDSGTRRDSPEGDVLSRLVTVRFDDLPLGLALHLIAQEGQLRLSYSSDVVPVARRVSVSKERTPVGDVLREALASTNVDAVVTPSGYGLLVRHPRAVAFVAPDSASGVVPAIERMPIRAQVMDRVLVMGTPAAGAPERELPSAVTVLTAGQIAAFGPSSMQDLLRSGIPGIVAWDLGIAGPFAQIGSVRGSSSFTSNYLKTYVDGVELASPYLLFAVDPFSIERIEIIRGPQGSALYGSDAISGVVHVITRRGSPSAAWRPVVDAQLSGGMVGSRYVEGAITSQRHSAMVSSGGGTTSLGLGGTWSATGGIVPGGESGYRATYGGFRHLAGFVRIEGTMRYADVRFTAPENPLLRADTLLSQVRSVLREQRIENETYGVTIDANPVEGMRHTLVIGLDRHDGAIPPQREPATVADALLGATRERAAKTSIRFSTALRVFENTSGGATLTMGTDHTDLSRERLGTSEDVGGDGAGLSALYHDEISNQGVFAQMKFDVARSVFLTAGMRGDWNSTFGEHLGAAWSPMLGLAVTRDVRGATVKLRGAYGKGIRPPPPSARQSIATLKFRQLGNAALEPETQSGIEGGIEVFAGDRAMLSVTGYSQVARGLIQQVIQDRRTIMYQNVGQIANRGAEIEGQLRQGTVRMNGTLSLTDSRVRALSRTYSGDLAVGDRVPEVPASSGGASLSWDVGRTTLTVGGSWIGPWTGYDWSRYVGDEAEESDEVSDLRNYWRDYPGLVRPYLSVSHILNRDVEWFGRVDNLTNIQRFERDNLQVTAGRTMTIGFRIGRN
ncbi:MAG: TonB-dependent receptor, partial [Gemmatimonadaceae bacterium]|nr:TonB-dependent receptor [Gemmatimonadaceae bacterium]